MIEQGAAALGGIAIAGRAEDTADTAEENAAPAETSPQEHGAQQIKDTVRRCAAGTGGQLQKRGQRGSSDAKRDAGKARDDIRKCKDASKGKQPKKAARQAARKTGKGTLKTARSAGKGTVKVARKGRDRAAAIGPIERLAFYDEGKTAYAIVATSENALYTNSMLQKGVVIERRCEDRSNTSRTAYRLRGAGRVFVC